jgi:gamma-glutamyltranspeptidase/glutathione hydrolase
MTLSTQGTYPSDDGRFTVFPSRRSVVHGTKGIVSTTSPLATEAGLRILRAGGNAAVSPSITRFPFSTLYLANHLLQDAAIAAAAVLNLVDPSMTGIGGDAFALFYSTGPGASVHAVNGSGRSAIGATLDGVCQDLNITDRVHGSIPTTSALSVTVPGAAAAWVDVVERFGSGKVSLGEVLAPAIEMAEEGVAVSELSSYYVGPLTPFPE